MEEIQGPMSHGDRIIFVSNRKAKPSSRRCRPPSFLRMTPINSGQQLSQLRRWHRPRAVGHARSQKPATLQSLREQAGALAVMPDHLQQIAAAPTKAKQMSAQRIAPQHLLHQQRQTRKALPHIGVTGRQPYTHAARKRDHARSSTARTRASAAESTPLSTTTRRPHANTISIRLATPTGQGECGKFSVPSTRSGNDGELVDEASRLIIAGANVAASSTSISRPARASRRQVNNWLADNPFRRAVADTTRGALQLSPTIRC